ncbi:MULTISPECIES: ABC transporter substrate-binding protein [unclassified Nocardioides]|uniref:ABC transporter substrate-binding protein n=1 Tax=unclassified Nocardioides TaxID=2615069 RepID=UPI00360BBE8D
MTTACTNTDPNAGSGAGTNDSRCQADAQPATGTDETAGDTIPATQKGIAEWGQDESDPCIYNGPGNFSLDLTDCPSSWDNNTGITDDSISLFSSVPKSGALAAVGGIGDGLKSYLNYVNDNGGIYGREVTLDVNDDQYQPDLTRKNVDAAIQADKYAASFSIIGTANNLAVRDTMDAACMGEYMVGATDEFFDPENYPWLTGFGLNYYNEAALLADALKQQFPDGADVAAIVIDNALGDAYLDGFERAIEGSNIELVDTQRNADDAPNVNDQVTSAAASDADATLVIEAGVLCSQAFAAIEKSSWDPTIVTGNQCAQISTTFAPMLEQGATGNGVQTVRYYYAPSDPDVEEQDKEFAKFMTDTLTSQGLDPQDGQVANGWFWGWYTVAVLKDASVMKGGLNRANINIAAHSYNSRWPMHIGEVSAAVSGVDDAFPFESGRVYEYTGAGNGSTGRFEPVGDLVTNEGELGNFSKISSGE